MIEELVSALAEDARTRIQWRGVVELEASDCARALHLLRMKDRLRWTTKCRESFRQHQRGADRPQEQAGHCPDRRQRDGSTSAWPESTPGRIDMRPDRPLPAGPCTLIDPCDPAYLTLTGAPEPNP